MSQVRAEALFSHCHLPATAQGLVRGRRMREIDKGWLLFSLYFIASHLDDWPKLRKQDPTRLPTRLFTSKSFFSKAVLDIFTSRFTCAQTFNFTRGLCLYKDYTARKDFVVSEDAWHSDNCELQMVVSLHVVAGI